MQEVFARNLSVRDLRPPELGHDDLIGLMHEGTQAPRRIVWMGYYSALCQLIEAAIREGRRPRVPHRCFNGNTGAVR